MFTANIGKYVPYLRLISEDAHPTAATPTLERDHPTAYSLKKPSYGQVNPVPWLHLPTGGPLWDRWTMVLIHHRTNIGGGVLGGSLSTALLGRFVLKDRGSWKVGASNYCRLGFIRHCA
jgi:hypothetical protein